MTGRGSGFNLIGEVMDDKICKKRIDFKVLSFNGIPIIADPAVPKGRMYLINPENIEESIVIHLRGNIFVRFFRELRRRVRMAWSILKSGDF